MAKGGKGKSGKGKKSEKPRDPVLAELNELVERGDNHALLARTREVLDDATVSGEVKAEAQAIRDGVKVDKLALAYVVGGLVVWVLVFYFGVIARQ